MGQNIAIGTDIGGSHISCAAVNLETGEILKDTLSLRLSDNQAQAFQIVSVWASCLQESIEKLPSGTKLNGIGFAMPGPFDYVNGIALFRGVKKYENLYGFSISDAIRSSLELSEEFPLRFINDATAFAVGEAWSGKAAGVSRSMAITLGTGFGSAFIKNRIPVVDGEDVPELGCVYHLPFRDSIADDYFSTRWFLRRYKEMSGSDIEGVNKLAEIAIEDSQVKELFEEFGRNLGVFLGPWLKRFKAEVLVSGGNISNAWSLFNDSFNQCLAEQDIETVTEVSEMGEDAALLGAAYLFNDKFWNSVRHSLSLM